MRTKKTCCCCGNKRCKDNEFQYSSTSGTDCRICALGRTTSSVDDFEMGAPEEPIPNQGDSPSGWGDDDGDPNNLHMGDICWHRGPADWTKYPSGECEWNDCWDDEEYGSWFSGAGANSEFSPPEVSFYQFQSPMGLLPWSPSVFKDWRDNWNGPLLPQGDCTMHCTEENIGCHTLAFVGAIGKNYGNTDNVDSVPLCGSDIVTIPPPIEEWGWVREWVQNGGKLIIMGESSGSPVESMPSCRSKLSFFDVDSTYYVEHCEEDVKTPMVSMTGEEVANVLYDFAHFCAWQSDESEPELFFEFETLEPGSQNFINDFDDDPDSEVSMSCCQRTKRPFLHRENDEDKMQPFSFACSSSSGLIPKKKGEAIVGHCGGDGCTVVYKRNGMGAVIVVYDSNVWGGSSTQVPMEWWNQEANHPKNIKLELSASELKERACNNDFWKFVCEDFLKDEEYHPHECDDANYWNHMSSDDWKMDENPCIKTAGCALPDGSCIETNVWDCFDQTSDDGRLTPGVWHGSEILHPSGMGGNACKSCGDINTSSFEEGVCCMIAPDGCDDAGECCISEDWYGGDVMYQYECECIAYERGDVDKIKWIAGEYECDACFKVGACCTIIDDWPYEECEDSVRQIVCEDEGGIFAGEDTICDDSPCSPLGACCLDDGTCVEQIMDLDCTNNDGTWAGADTTCEECDNIFACCFDDAVTPCVDMLRSKCEEEEGQFLEGAMCDDNQCEPPTACCHGSNEGCQQCAVMIPWICEMQLLGTPMYINGDTPQNCIGGWPADIPPDTGCDVEDFPPECLSVCVVDECNINGPCCEQDPEEGCVCNVVLGKECITDTEAETLIKKVWNGAFGEEFTCENNSCCGVCCNIDSEIQDDECGFIDEECGWTATEDYCYDNTTNSLWVSCTADGDVDDGLGDVCSCSCACTANENECVEKYAEYEDTSYVNCGWHLNEMCCTETGQCLDGVSRCECIIEYNGTPFIGRTCDGSDFMCEIGVCCVGEGCIDNNNQDDGFVRRVECMELGGAFVEDGDCSDSGVCELGACCYQDEEFSVGDMENKCVMVASVAVCSNDYGGNFFPYPNACPCTPDSIDSPCNRGGACCVRTKENYNTSDDFRGYCYMTDLDTCKDSCIDYDEDTDFCNFCWKEYEECDTLNGCDVCNVCDSDAADCPNDNGATWTWNCHIGICTTSSMIGCRYSSYGSSTGCNTDNNCIFYTGSDPLDPSEYYCVSPARTTEDCQSFDCNEVRGCCIWCGNNPGDELHPNCAINDVTYPECLGLGHPETVWIPVETCCAGSSAEWD